METEIVFKTVCAAVMLAMAMYYLKRKNRAFSVGWGAASGLAALFLLERFGSIIQVSVVLNAFTLTGAAVLGVPFVVIILIMNFL